LFQLGVALFPFSLGLYPDLLERLLFLSLVYKAFIHKRKIQNWPMYSFGCVSNQSLSFRN
jgi:hypothetical protein